MLDEVGDLTVNSWFGPNCVKCLKRRQNEKNGLEKQKIY